MLNGSLCVFYSAACLVATITDLGAYRLNRWLFEF